jgi:aspartate ammonia-lyase
MSEAGPTRTEIDPLGPVEVPRGALYGAQTERARANFPLTGLPIAAFPELIAALARVKKAAALVNSRSGDVPADIAAAIVTACDELIAGRHHEHFPVDACQGGAGTSTNMNANEVIAHRAEQIMGAPRGSVSPNDHVNRNQSTNDAYATAVRLAVHALNARLGAALEGLAAGMNDRAAAFAAIRKLGRTQLQDAVPMTLGQEFGAYATTLR